MCVYIFMYDVRLLDMMIFLSFVGILSIAATTAIIIIIIITTTNSTTDDAAAAAAVAAAANTVVTMSVFCSRRSLFLY